VSRFGSIHHEIIRFRFGGGGHAPPFWAGTKAAAEAISEARITEFMLENWIGFNPIAEVFVGNNVDRSIAGRLEKHPKSHTTR